MKSSDNPCYGCVEPKRHLGCHSECPEREAYITKLRAEKAKIKKEKDIINDFKVYREYTHQRLKNWDKKKGKK